MTFDSYNVETNPHLIQMRQDINELERLKDEARAASEASPDDVKVRLRYDLLTIKWARATNDYHSALRAELAL